MTEPALAIRSLHVTLAGRPILRGATAAFARGGIHAVIGRSGAGKSVLMKAASGLLPFERGEVTVSCGNETLILTASEDALAWRKARRVLTFVHQDPALLDDLTARDNVTFAAQRRFPDDPLRVREEAERWLAALSLERVADRLPRALTPSEQRRVALCRALCLRPEVLIVDEPTTGLDPLAAREVDDALLALFEHGATLVVITHDRRSLARLSPRLTWVDGGTVRAQLSFEEAAEAAHPRLSALLEGRPAPAEEEEMVT